MTRRIPQWLADWLDIAPGGVADGATWQVDSAWSWPPWATLLLAVAALLFIAILYARESSSAGRAYRVLLTTLRCGAISLVLIMLAQWALSVRLTGPPAIALIIDRSASMAIADQYQVNELPAPIRERLVASGLSEPTRLNLAKLLATADDAKLLKSLADRWRLHVYFAAAGIERAEEADDPNNLKNRIRELSSEGPDSSATRLGDAVRQVLSEFRGAPPTAIILFTDGVTTEGLPLENAAQDARTSGVSIFAVGLGSGQPPRDIEVADVLVDDAVFVGDLVGLQVQIKATGLDGQPATVTLRRQGEQTTIANENITLPSTGQTATVQLVDRPTAAGEVSYVVEVAPREDEKNRQNNRQQRKVAVRDDKIRVLMVFGYPSYEFRFLKSLLERDSTIQLFTYLQDADPGYAAQDKTALPRLPVSRDELFKCDVLILGDVNPRLVTPSLWQHLRAFVAEKGGGVTFIAGPRFFPSLYSDQTDVNALLPFGSNSTVTSTHREASAEVSRGFQVQPTPLGLQHPALQLGNTPAETEKVWRDLAPLYWLYETTDLKPAAQVLAQSASSSPTVAGNPPSSIPVICFQYVGPGRVLFHAVDSTWRWRIGAGDVYFARYWVQSIRFLARAKLAAGRGVQLTSDRREYTRGEPVELRVRFLDRSLAPAGDEATLLVESPGIVRRRVTLRRNPAATNMFAGTFSDFTQGAYEVSLADPQVPGTPPSIRMTVVDPPGELARPIMDAAALTAAAEITHGKFYTITSADQLLTDLPAGRRVPVEILPPVSIWNRWWLLAAFLICITSEWILRKRKGML
jgi:hypothetical protein